MFQLFFLTRKEKKNFFYLLLKLPKFKIWKVFYTLQSGCRIIYQAKALGNAKDRLYLTNS